MSEDGSPTSPRKLVASGSEKEALVDQPNSIWNPGRVLWVCRDPGHHESGKRQFDLGFRVKESLLDLLRLESNVVAIALADVIDLEFKKGWFTRSIVIRVNRLEVLRPVPGSKAGEVRLRIARQHEPMAEELVCGIRMALTTHRLKKLIDSMDAPNPEKLKN